VTRDLQAVEKRLRAAVESSPSGLLMVDAAGRIVLVNREVERLFGYSREELLGKPVDVLVPERFRGNHPHYRSGFVAHPSVRAMGAGRDLFGVRKDGTEVPVEIGLTPVATEEGLFVLGSIVDISARKRAEEQRRELEELLRQSQKMEAVGTLAGGIAHDFNNILGAIIGFAEFLEHDLTTEQARADLAEVLKAAERGKELVERILSFSRRRERLLQPLDLGNTLQESAKLLRATLPSPVEIHVVVDPHTPRIMADATSVQQVIMNLATNAAHAMPGGGRFEVRAEPFYVRDSVARKYPGLHEGPHAVLTARDTGHGIDRSVRDRVFEPFFTTKPTGVGTGLGLALVHGIMRDHGGVVELESEPGVGTTVRCLFPAHLSDQAEAPIPSVGTPRGNGQHVLLVEDEESLARVGERRLLALGYRTTVITDSLQAEKAFRAASADFDIVVTDYSMPHMTGIDLGRALRAIRPEIPLILVTGLMEELAPERVQSVGIRRVLKKPITAHELGVAIHEVLASSTTT
jgi:PAS domain S-box-containing protein